MSFVFYGITLVQRMVKQSEVISFLSGKKIWIILLYWQLVREYEDSIINLN